MKDTLKAIGYISIVVAALFAAPWACTRPKAAIKTLTEQGYTHIEVTGWRPFMADKDTFSTGFRAQSPSGHTVTGAVTSGVLKGSTIRVD